MLRTLHKAVTIASALTLVVAFFNRNDLPGSIDFHPRLKDEPRQRAIEKAPSIVPYAGVDYRVEPLFSYELYGLVVSYRQHDGEDSMHRWSNDHLNVADVCVVWSDTAFAPTLRKVEFWNGIFTCNFSTRDSEAWARLRTDQVANNHLLSADPAVRERVAAIRIGDQIRVRGWLASYGSGAGKRGTSTTRDDTGDGACETIFIDDFAILEAAPGGWRWTLYAALAVLGAALLAHFRRPYRPYA